MKRRQCPLCDSYDVGPSWWIPEKMFCHDCGHVGPSTEFIHLVPSLWARLVRALKGRK
jgi:hypothetical protein